MNYHDEQIGYDRGTTPRLNAYIQETGWSPLIYAAANGHIETVKLLIEPGADVNLVRKNRTALLAAVSNKDSKCVELLIEAGASVNATFMDTIKTTTPVREVVQCGTLKILSILIQAGADVNFGGGQSPLFTAALYGKIEFIKPLVDAGADLNRQNDDGETPLHETLKYFYQTSFYVLMDLGANVNISDNKGFTPLMLAARFCCRLQDMIRTGCSTTEIASEKAGAIERICRLFRAGAQIGRKDHLGRNSLQVSLQSHQEEVKDIQMLLFAAGETLDGPIVSVEHIDIPEYFTELKENLDLKHLCREAIRKHLIHLDPHGHLFWRIPQLGLPSLVTEYLLYDCSLESETGTFAPDNKLN